MTTGCNLFLVIPNQVLKQVQDLAISGSRFFDTFDVAKPRFSNGGNKRRFLRQAQDAEFIEVQGQP